MDSRLVSRKLSRWFARHARRLPWRDQPTPYRVWISEIMLQQTQVATVLPYFNRFIARIPNIAALAEADEQDVLALWSGLGYYRRARLMHKAAREIAARHGGEFPRDFDAVLALPGIGRYTAGAICSIAFEQARPVLDGNVERVLARLTALRADVKSAAAQARLWTLATSLAEAAAKPSVLNQALMELGALVCTHRNFSCKVCPLARQCAANAAGIAERLPVKAKPGRATNVRYAALVLSDAGGRLLLTRRENRGESLLPRGLWEFPHLPWDEGDKPPLDQLCEVTGVAIAGAHIIMPVRHAIMNYRVTLAGVAAKTSGRTAKVRPPHKWFDASEIHRLPLASCTRKLLATLEESWPQAGPFAGRRELSPRT